MKGTVFSAGRAVVALAVSFFLAVSAGAAEGRDHLEIIASLFPQYDFSRRIAGDRANVKMLLPPGAESHSYEPTPSDMKAIAAADLFIYTGDHMEPWAGRLAAAVTGPGSARIVDASQGITLNAPAEGGDHDDHDDHDHDHDHGDSHFHELDPHIWLDPRLAAVMAENIAAALIETDPANAALYRSNADRLVGELMALDAEFQKTVAAAPRRALVFGERFAFGYFFRRYGLEEIGAYKSCAPGAEPGMKAVIEVIGYIRAGAVRFVYREAMAKGRISEVLREETGVEILAVDSLHNLPADKLNAGAGYIDIMRDNMAAFAKGLQ